MKAKVKAWLRLRLKHHNHHKAPYQWNHLIPSHTLSAVFSNNTVFPAYHLIGFLSLWSPNRHNIINWQIYLTLWTYKERDTDTSEFVYTHSHTFMHTHTRPHLAQWGQGAGYVKTSRIVGVWCFLILPPLHCPSAMLHLSGCPNAYSSFYLQESRERKGERPR